MITIYQEETLLGSVNWTIENNNNYYIILSAFLIYLETYDYLRQLWKLFPIWGNLYIDLYIYGKLIFQFFNVVLWYYSTDFIRFHVNLLVDNIILFYKFVWNPLIVDISIDEELRILLFGNVEWLDIHLSNILCLLISISSVKYIFKNFVLSFIMNSRWIIGQIPEVFILKVEESYF